MKKALIIRLSSLGDVVLSSVIFDPLREGGFEPYLLTLKPYDELFTDDHRVRVIGTTKRKIFKRELIESLKEEGFEVFIDIHKVLRSYRLRLLLGGRWISYRKDSLRRRFFVWFRLFRKRFFVPSSYAEVLKKLGIDPPLNPRPSLVVSEDRIKRLKERLPERFIAIGAGAQYEKKRYPYFLEVARMLIGEGLDVVWVGDAKDRERLGEVPGVNLCGELPLSDVPAVIKMAVVFGGNDSGLTHVARAVGTPAVQVFGGTHPDLGFALADDEGEVVFKDIPCQPCDLHGKGTCRYGDLRCLDIPPKEVFERMMSIISKRL